MLYFLTYCECRKWNIGVERYRGIALSSQAQRLILRSAYIVTEKRIEIKKINAAFAYTVRVPICRRARAGQLRETRYKF